MAEIVELIKVLPFLDGVVGSGTLIAITLIVGALALQKVLGVWKNDSAGNDLISNLHKELTRVTEQNTNMFNQMAEMQTEITKLRNQLIETNARNTELSKQVEALQKELQWLHSIVPDDLMTTTQFQIKRSEIIK